MVIGPRVRLPAQADPIPKPELANDGHPLGLEAGIAEEAKAAAEAACHDRRYGELDEAALGVAIPDADGGDGSGGKFLMVKGDLFALLQDHQLAIRQEGEVLAHGLRMPKAIRAHWAHR